MPKQPDLFGYAPPQGDLFAGLDVEQPRRAIDPADIRRRLLGLLDHARSAGTTSPWDDRTTQAYRLLFPQMSNWLPREEAEHLCLAFEAAIERFDRAA